MTSLKEDGFDGAAIVYCEGAFRTPNGKTAHGLVRFTRRYHIVAVIDSSCAGEDAGVVLDGQKRGVPLVPSLKDGLQQAESSGMTAKRFVVGLAPDGGIADESLVDAVQEALESGLSVDSGLHTHFSTFPALRQLAEEKGLVIRDIRQSPPPDRLHFFSGEIARVRSCRLAMLGTDSAVGKRTSAWMLVSALEKAGFSAEMIGTGQTAWLQGARYGVLMDALINDFVSGEIEHAICRAWRENHPQMMVIEGQGSLLNPAYPGGFEILAAGRPHGVVLQHAPKRRDYDGFPGIPLHSLDKQIRAVEAIHGHRPWAVAINQEGMNPSEIDASCRSIESCFGIPCVAPLCHGFSSLLSAWKERIARILSENG